MSEERSPSRIAASMLHRAESIVLALIAVVLIILALMLLGSSTMSLVNAFREGQVSTSAIDILDSVLLVMMMMEIVYTVAVSLESHSLVAEPFLVVGLIAAIRRMLIITAESTRVEATNTDAFRSLLIELALLAFIVIGMAVSVYVLRRSNKFLLPRADEEA